MQITTVPTPRYEVSVDEKELRTLRDGLRKMNGTAIPAPEQKRIDDMLPAIEQMGLGEF